ncbi:hypothetical protein Tsubulata_021896 [Turnera subulata]|uniref:Cytochrome P450 n=1 Tax=Turnera subulata TaxID=218843 RepID=A0A9Q0FWP7_9ROSI|nr:hypothetical protein Tsubulata_021896 [Turnera subulata]
MMMAAGKGKVSVTLEWAMTMLLNNPAKLDMNVCRMNWIFPKLPYLNCVISITSNQTCLKIVSCPAIPGVNVWLRIGIPKARPEPHKLQPQRFEGEREGSKFAPCIWDGRRICAGTTMAMPMLCNLHAIAYWVVWFNALSGRRWAWKSRWIISSNLFQEKAFECCMYVLHVQIYMVQVQSNV